MRNRVFRHIISLATILLVTGLPTQAAPVVVTEVIQVLSNYQNPPDLRLKNVPVNGEQTRSSRLTSTAQTDSFNVTHWALNPTSDSLLAGVAIGSDPQKIEVIAQGDVEGTVCDCGEILVAGGFPKWPLILLAGIPFIFIRDCESCDETPVPPVFPTPTPPTQTTPTPEPASLLLFGTGLAIFGAGLRRRYSRRKKLAQSGAADEGGQANEI